jgi:outer membrane protein TolC
VTLAKETYERLQREYVNGVSAYLDFLTALVDLQSLQQELIEAHRLQIEYRIALYRALAGPIPTHRDESSAFE